MIPLSACSLLAAARLDIGFGNPNKTAALFAMLAVWTLSRAVRSSRAWLAWTFWIATSALGVMLALTGSRGGVVAFAAGAAVVGAANLKSMLRLSRILPVVLIVAALVGAAFASGLSARMSKIAPGDDESVEHRLVIWRAAPAMIHDAPCGWGKGNAGEAFTNWYQPLDRRERYRTLVNSHLTELVERGWLG